MLSAGLVYARSSFEITSGRLDLKVRQVIPPMSLYPGRSTGTMPGCADWVARSRAQARLPEASSYAPRKVRRFPVTPLAS